MNVRRHLLALVEELLRLKANGEQNVVVTEASLAKLRRAIAPSTVVPEVAEPPLAPESTAIFSPPLAPVPKKPLLVTSAASSLPSIPAKAPVFILPAGDKRARWEALKEKVLGDPVCQQHVRPRKKMVLGMGNFDAQVFFCGEAPGAEEEIQGEPFVGPAGQLLTRMIRGMGLEREEVYIGNIMNWRPEMPIDFGGLQFGNRPPTPKEMNYCLPYLKAQLEIVQPKLIVALGATAAGGLLGTESVRTLGEIRGRWHTFDGLPVMVTYHPSYILRNQSNRSKRMIWEDLLKVMERAELPISEKQRRYFLT